MTYRRTALALIAGLATLPLAAPALARPAKPTTIRMPAAALKDPTARLCMPRTILPKDAAAGLPETVCKTRDDWAAAGVTIEQRG